MLPETSRKDVSETELQLRRQDKAARNLRYFEVIVLIIIILVSLFSLFKLLEIAQTNRNNIENHRKDSQKVHAQIEALICNVILPRPTVTEEEKRVCAEIKKNNETVERE